MIGGSVYRYNDLGHRLEQTIGAAVIKYVLDQQPGLVQVLTQTTGTNTDRYIHGLTGIHAHKDAAGNWEYPVQDGLRSERGVVDAKANFISSPIRLQ